MNRKTTFHNDTLPSKLRFHEQNAGIVEKHLGGGPHPPSDELHKERPESSYTPDQGLSATKSNQPRTLRHGFERLCHMYSLRIPVKFEELQGRHPFDFVEETRDHYRLHSDPVKKPAQPVDSSLFNVREWLEPLLRKGQLYWDYCRDKWLEKESKLGAACAPVCCTYSLWSVTGSCLQYGGLVFMTVYLFLTLVFIIPLIYMELAIGQFHRQGLLKAIQQICPLLQGLAYLMLFSCLCDYLLSMTRVTWLFYYLQMSMHIRFPWKLCNNSQSLDPSHCRETLDHHQINWSYTGDERTPAADWYRVHVCRPWNHWNIIHDDPQWTQVAAGLLPHPRILVSFLTLFLIFRILMKLCCRTLGRFMLLMFYVAFILSGLSLLTFSHTFPVDLLPTVTNWFFRRDHLKYFWYKDTWTAAVKQAVISSGVGTGIYITFGSHNTFPQDEIKRLSVLSGLASLLIHCVIAIFFIFCHFTIRTTIAFQNATTDNYGSDLVFEVFPQVAAQHHQQGVGYTIFVTMTMALLLYASLRALSSLHTIRQHFFDRHKEYYEPTRVNHNYWEHDKMTRQQRYMNLLLVPKRKGQLMTKIMVFAGLFHLITFISGGSTILFVLEAFWYNCVPMFILMVECVAIFFFAGVRTLNDYIRKMTTWQVTLWYRFLWKIIIPLVPILYITQLPRTDGIDQIIGMKTSGVVDLLSHIFCGLPLFFMYLSVLHEWRRSRAVKCCDKFLLEVTPEHEQSGMIAGRKPCSRLHWMHHLQVPSGISRGLCLPSYEGHPRKPNSDRFYWDNRLMYFLWFTLKLKWFNKIRDGCIHYEDPSARFFYLFPPIPYPVKPTKKNPKFPDYLPNQAIKRVHKLKKYKDFTKQRKHWLSEKVDVERERMEAEHDGRDIEAAIRQVVEEEDDVERNVFDIFDFSSGDKGLPTDSGTSSENSWNFSSDADVSYISSPSVSSSDGFDSRNSLFLGSGEETFFKTRKISEKDSDSSLDNSGLDATLAELELGLDSDADECRAPVMDYDEEDGIPFDEETDSWELEELEYVEGAKVDERLNRDTSEEETDTGGLIEDLEESQETSSEEDGNMNDDDADEEDEVNEDTLGPELISKRKSVEDDTKKDTRSNLPEEGSSDSWSTSCGTDSSCSSSGTGSDESDSDDDTSKVRGVSVESEEDDQADDDDGNSLPGALNRAQTKSLRLTFFKSIAERLDTFLHISQKKERVRIPVIQEQVGKAKREEKQHEKEKEKTDSF